MLRVGLTGGIGSGKSTVAQLFAGHGVPVVDTDELARDAVKPGEPGHAEIVRQFGTTILDTSGALERTKMRERVFSDSAERKKLEEILHPRIRDAVSRRLAMLESPYVIIVVPLLIETSFDELVDRILVVDCDEAMQIQRVVTRSGMTENQVRRVMAAQVSRQERLARADDVIENNGALAQLDQQVAQLHRRYLALGGG